MKNDERTAAEQAEQAAAELKREYYRQYRARKKAEAAEYNRRYWQNQLDDLETELGRCEAWDLLEYLRTAEGAELAEVIREALKRVEKLPSGLQNVAGGRS